MHVLIYVLKIEKLKQESVIYSTINYGFFHIVISAVTDVLIYRRQRYAPVHR